MIFDFRQEGLTLTASIIVKPGSLLASDNLAAAFPFDYEKLNNSISRFRKGPQGYLTFNCRGLCVP